MSFQLNNIPDQAGRIAIVTGSNIGLGYETALGFAQKNMEVVLACRNLDKANAAATKIRAQVPQAKLRMLQLDLSSLESVRTFARAYSDFYDRLDLLVNNAGVMIPPYTQTEDGMELQFGVNYAGHFLLTALLLEVLEATPDSRIVTLSSIAHKNGKIQFDDLQYAKRYSAVGAYAQSKAACLIFTFELDRLLRKHGYQTISVGSHPGVSDTNLAQHMPKFVLNYLYPIFAPLVTHSAASGALPSLMAALDANVQGGDYYGPQGFREMQGKPGKARYKRFTKDPAIAQKLWSITEELVGQKFHFD